MNKYLFLFLFCSLRVLGQNSDIHFQNWFDFNVDYKLDQKWKLYGDTGYRISYSPYITNRLYIRPGVSYKTSSTTNLTGGIGIFSAFYKQNVFWETRFFQGFQLIWPIINSFKLNNYFRIEERFFSSNSVNTFLLRLRYRIGTDIKIVQDYFILLEQEWFVNYGTDIDFQLNEIRSNLGLRYVIDDFWKLELISIFQNINASNDLFSINNIIFRFRLFKELN